MATEQEREVGFIYLKETGKETVELYVMGVLKEYHRRGIGRELFEAAKACAVNKGYSFMQVKTVQMEKYKEYDDTNCFYIEMGFKEFEVSPTLWDEWNPCQIYVMSLRILFLRKVTNIKRNVEDVMDNFVDERDYRILENDKYSFFVLRRIIGGKCELLLTDHERLIICFTTNPYPVWIWTPDEASEEDMERAYQLAAEHSLLNGEYHFNLKYDLADYFIKRAAADHKKISISRNMYAYDCHDLVKPTVIAGGSIHHCSSNDLDELVEFLELFHNETGIDQNDRGGYRLRAEAFIKAGNMYFWKEKHGNNAASCTFAPNGNMSSINLVFTRPEFRRNHYAENLVYQVTKIVMDAGYIPMLYTDADYAASNACYEKIGYVLKGKLCTIG